MLLPLLGMSAVAQTQHAERRLAHRINLGNVIARADLCDGSEPVLVCVWDLSLTGACVLVPPDVTIPEQFKILFDHAVRDARVVWRTWSHVGVHFSESL